MPSAAASGRDTCRLTLQIYNAGIILSAQNRDVKPVHSVTKGFAAIGILRTLFRETLAEYLNVSNDYFVFPTSTTYNHNLVW